MLFEYIAVHYMLYDYNISTIAQQPYIKDRAYTVMCTENQGNWAHTGIVVSTPINSYTKQRNSEVKQQLL